MAAVVSALISSASLVVAILSMRNARQAKLLSEQATLLAGFPSVRVKRAIQNGRFVYTMLNAGPQEALFSLSAESQSVWGVVEPNDEARLDDGVDQAVNRALSVRLWVTTEELRAVRYYDLRLAPTAEELTGALPPVVARGHVLDQLRIREVAKALVPD